MMAKAGFTEGAGLGRSRQGRLDPVAAVAHDRRRGLGFDYGAWSHDATGSRGGASAATRGHTPPRRPESQRPRKRTKTHDDTRQPQHRGGRDRGRHGGQRNSGGRGDAGRRAGTQKQGGRGPPARAPAAEARGAPPGRSESPERGTRERG